jgi:hypothetical protein
MPLGKEIMPLDKETQLLTVYIYIWVYIYIFYLFRVFFIYIIIYLYISIYIYTNLFCTELATGGSGSPPSCQIYNTTTALLYHSYINDYVQILLLQIWRNDLYVLYIYLLYVYIYMKQKQTNNSISCSNQCTELATARCAGSRKSCYIHMYI